MHENSRDYKDRMLGEKKGINLEVVSMPQIMFESRKKSA
jgi:hypothetical protein